MIMFLVRTTFWVCLVVLLLPMDKTKIDPAVTDSISMGNAVEIASGALSDVTDFCVRQPDVCKQGQEVFVAFSHKAKYASALLYQFFDGQLTPQSETVDEVENG